MGSGHTGLPLELGVHELNPSLHDTFLLLGLSPAPLPPSYWLGPGPCKAQTAGTSRELFRPLPCLAAYLLCCTWRLSPAPPTPAPRQPGRSPTWSPACHSLLLGLTDRPFSVPESRNSWPFGPQLPSPEPAPAAALPTFCICHRLFPQSKEPLPRSATQAAKQLPSTRGTSLCWHATSSNLPQTPPRGLASQGPSDLLSLPPRSPCHRARAGVPMACPYGHPVPVCPGLCLPHVSGGF